MIFLGLIFVYFLLPAAIVMILYYTIKADVRNAIIEARNDRSNW